MTKPVKFKRFRRNKSNNIKKVTNNNQSGSYKLLEGKWPRHLWMIYVAHFVYRLWYFLVLLNLFCWYIFNNTDIVFIRVLIYQQNYCLFTFFSLLSLYKLQERGEIKQRKKKEWFWRHTDNNITSTVKNISMRRIKRYRKRSYKWIESCFQ